MNVDQILSEIREANLSYLMLAQSLIRSDKEQALFRLGISEESAALLALLTPAQMMKIASGNTLLCRFRMDDDLVWGLLTNHGKGAANDTTSRLHDSILMAGRHQEAARSARRHTTYNTARTTTCAPRASSQKRSRSAARSR